VSTVLPEVDERVAQAWNALSTVEDPEIPAVNIVDLGLIRFCENAG